MKWMNEVWKSFHVTVTELGKPVSSKYRWAWDNSSIQGYVQHVRSAFPVETAVCSERSSSPAGPWRFDALQPTQAPRPAQQLSIVPPQGAVQRSARCGFPGPLFQQHNQSGCDAHVRRGETSLVQYLSQRSDWTQQVTLIYSFVLDCFSFLTNLTWI